MGINFKKLYISLLLTVLAIPLIADEYSFSPLKSLLLPGWGQISSNHNIGYLQLGMEVAIISSLYYFDNEADLKLDQSINYAVKYAHINPINHTDSYYRMIGRYNSSYYETGGFNQQVLNDAIANYPGDPNAQQQYIADNEIPNELNWRWDDKSNRHKYNDLRRDYFFNQDYAKIFTGVLIANHMFSFIDMLIKYKHQDKSAKYSFFSTINQDKNPLIFLQYKF